MGEEVVDGELRGAEGVREVEVEGFVGGLGVGVGGFGVVGVPEVGPGLEA